MFMTTNTLINADVIFVLVLQIDVISSYSL